jgi:hypothetical protein
MEIMLKNVDTITRKYIERDDTGDGYIWGR